mmetsp:Transcript_21912/g.36216  ORF Transcript_21912/g.36216 Transcript_21912/m.36216 type:complete len:85 (+) Transcript_21912:2172-2426(+)
MLNIMLSSFSRDDAGGGVSTQDVVVGMILVFVSIIPLAVGWYGKKYVNSYMKEVRAAIVKDMERAGDDQQQEQVEEAVRFLSDN